MASLGERFAFYRLPTSDESERAKRALEFTGKEHQMRNELSETVRNLFAGITIPTGAPSLSDPEKDKLIALATLTTRCRSAVEREPFSSREITLVPGAESPTRFVKMLALLLGGLYAIGCERRRAWEIVEKVSLDSLPMIRREVLEKLIKSQEGRTTTDLATALGYPTTTTKRALEDLACYDVLVRTSGGKGKPDTWYSSEWTDTLYPAAVTKLPENTSQTLENAATMRVKGAEEASKPEIRVGDITPPQEPSSVSFNDTDILSSRISGLPPDSGAFTRSGSGSNPPLPVESDVESQPPDDPFDDPDEDEILTLAETDGWRKLEIEPGVAVGGTEQLWQIAARNPNAARRAKVLAKLRERVQK